MLKNWFLITAASFGVGFGVTYIFTQTPATSAIAGAAGTAGAFSSVLACSKQRKQELARQAQSMQVTVNILEQQEKTLGLQLQSHQDNRQTIQYQIEQLEQQITGLQSKQQGQEASVAKFDREIATKKDNVLDLDNKRVELANLIAEIATMQQQQNTAQAALLELQNIETEINIYSTTKAQLVSEVTRLEEYKTEIKIQIADDKDICEKAEEYLQCIDQEVNDKQEDLLELDTNIKTKLSELNNCRQQLVELAQQRNSAELAITNLALELQQVGDAILNQENIQHAAEAKSAQLASDISSLQLVLLDCHSQMTDTSLQYVDVSPVPELPELAASELKLVDIQPIELASVTAEPILDYADYLQPIAALSEPELNEPTAQFVEFQPAALSIYDLEETSPISASSFNDLCEMELLDISVNTLELGLLDLLDLEDMTLDQDSLDALNVNELDLNDVTFDQEPFHPSANISGSNWTASFAGNPYLEVLQHIDQQGSIEHFEVATLLNDKKLARQFATKLTEYAGLLPFAIDIETTKTGNRYQKRALVLIQA
jgi:hypothetical protein